MKKSIGPVVYSVTYNGPDGEATEGRLTRCDGRTVTWTPRWSGEAESDFYEGEWESWINLTDVEVPAFHLNVRQRRDRKKRARFACSACKAEWDDPIFEALTRIYSSARLEALFNEPAPIFQMIGKS